VLRLTPLFVVFVGLLWAIALAASDYRLRVSVPRAALETLQWLTFTTAGMPNLNHAPTAIIGGAAWSLPYEWWFYFALPLAGRLMALRPSRVWLILSVVATAGGVWWISSRGGWLNAAAFLGGIASAFLVRQPRACAVARQPAASFVCLGVLAAVTRFDTAFAPAPLLLLSLAFAIIACGNSMFGALEWRAVRGLGDMGYSVYLLHGLVLFAAFALLLGPERSAGLSTTGHWLVVDVCAVVVTVVSYTTFYLIEARAMRSVDRANALMAP
jgi:peptidoglycan/LPS O-acetylase OafA/YrhL